MNLTHPGYNDQDALKTEWPKMSKQIVSFMIKDFRHESFICDVGDNGYKSNYLRRYNKVYQLTSDDFNTKGIYGRDNAPIITCFETIEHIQNPLFFFNNITKHLMKGGVIYLSTPCRPRMFWPDFHFFEMDENHLQRWILEPCGFKVVRRKKLWIRDCHKWWFYFTGIRPFLRLFFGYTMIYEIRKT